MSDPTESIRRQRLAELNAEPGSREALEAVHGQVWNTEELARDFIVIGFLAPLVIVKRKTDSVKGSLEFASTSTSSPNKFNGLRWASRTTPSHRHTHTGTNMLRNELETHLIDADPSFDTQQHVKVAVNQRGVSIEAPGYGDCCTAEGHGSPVFLELHQGRLRLIIWADINNEEPTHIIDLAGAKEERRSGVLPKHPLGQQGEQTS